MSALGNPRLDPIPGPVPPAGAPGPVPVEPPPSRGWTKWIVLGLTLVAGATGLMLWRKQDTAKQQQQAVAASVKTAKVSQGRLTQKVRINGPTSAREYANVIAPIIRSPEAGRELILLYLVQSGAKVKKGAKIAQIDAKTLEDHIDDINDDINQADGDIRKRKSEHQVDLEGLLQSIRVAKSDLDKARLEAKPTELRTPIEQELLKLAVDEADARYKQVQGDVQYKKVVQEAEIKILGITRQRHVRHQNRHKADLEKFTIFAPMDGLAVVQMAWRGQEFTTIQQGDNITPGQLFLKVVNPAKMQVDANINQTETTMFRIGQKAVVELDAFPGLKMPGHVQSIGALAAGGFRQQFYIRNVPVKIAIDEPDSKLIPDLSASADVEIHAADNVKQVPLGALFNEGKTSFVYVRQGALWSKRTVETGLRSNTHAAVTSGLEVGDEVALDRPAEMKQEKELVSLAR
ncbi:MAG: HlyD family efflux transporter periplasmic adaptor subunit [Bryobacteraceae bacterium]